MVQRCLGKKLKGSGLKSKVANTATQVRPALMTIYRALVKPHLDYGDLFFDKAWNTSFHQKKFHRVIHKVSFHREFHHV